jgi:hypothetical protein
MTDIRKLIDTLDSIEEGEIGRKIGSTIGGVFGDRAAKIGGDLGDKAGDFLDKFNPFSGSGDPDKPESDKDSDKDASGNGFRVIPTPAGIKPDQYDITDKPPPAGSRDEITRDIPPHLADASSHDPEVLQFNSGGKFFRVARDWKDGTPRPNEDGEYQTEFMKQPQSMEIMQIEPDQSWAATDPQKIFINYDGSQIRTRSGYDDTLPEDPKHPFYHRIFAMAGASFGQRQDPYRGGITRLNLRDSRGLRHRDYKSPSKSCPVVWTAPPGYSAGGDHKRIWSKVMDQEQYGHKLMGGFQSAGGGTIMITWTPNRFLSPDGINQAVAGAVEDTGAKAASEMADQYKAKISKLQPIIFNHPQFGKFAGQTFLASSSMFSSNKRVANAINFIGNQSSEGPHTDQIMAWYYGPSDEWDRTGYPAMNQFISSLKFRDGVTRLGKKSPKDDKPLDEELARIIHLARRTHP